MGGLRSGFKPAGVPVMKGVEAERKYLIECKVQEYPRLLRKGARAYWTNKIEAMPEGEVLDRYYKETRHD